MFETPTNRTLLQLLTERAERALTGALHNPRALVGLVSAYVVIITLIYGVFFHDQANLLAIWRYGSVEGLEIPRGFLFDNLVPNLIGGLLIGPFGDASYWVVALLGGVLGIAGSLVVLLRTAQGPERAFVVLAFLAAGVVPCVLFWLGKSDGFLVFFYVCAFALRGHLLGSALFLTLVMLTHPTQGTMILALHGLLALLAGGPRGAKLTALAAVAIGFGLGQLGHLAYDALALAHDGQQERMAFVANNLVLIASTMALNPALSVYTAYNLMWLAILARALSPGQWPFALLALSPFVVGVGIDHTRLKVLIGLPVVLFTAVWLAQHRPAETSGFIQRHALGLMLAGLIAFQVIVGGEVRSWTWPYLAAHLLRQDTMPTPVE